MRRIAWLLGFAAAGALFLTTAVLGGGQAPAAAAGSQTCPEPCRGAITPRHEPPAAADLRVEVPPPPFSDGIFPCTNCHNKDMPANRTRRQLSDMHTDIELKHDAEHRWCLDCHDADQRDQLHLASGEPVPFEESYRLCGQCHGEKYRDWRAGVHGRRVGQWNGAKRYLLCVHCHSPHQPRFKPMAPTAAPVKPQRIR